MREREREMKRVRETEGGKERGKEGKKGTRGRAMERSRQTIRLRGGLKNEDKGQERHRDIELLKEYYRSEMDV